MEIKLNRFSVSLSYPLWIKIHNWCYSVSFVSLAAVSEKKKKTNKETKTEYGLILVFPQLFLCMRV